MVKAWIKVDDTLVVAENHLGKDKGDLGFILKEAENNIDKIKSAWQKKFGVINSIYYGTQPEKKKGFKDYSRKKKRK